MYIMHEVHRLFMMYCVVATERPMQDTGVRFRLELR